MSKTAMAMEAVAAREYMRLPARGGDPIFGITRPTYYNMIKAGAIKSACIRRPGCTTGIRLVNVASVRQYVERHIEGGVQL